MRAALPEGPTPAPDRPDHPECACRRTHAPLLAEITSLAAPELRRLACDAAVIPIVMNGAGQPLDVGRLTRTIPDGLRRAVAARDGGCAFPGFGSTPSWCECHHILPWEHGGPTERDNLVMLCRVHHRMMHSSGWMVRIRDGLPEFIPPKWIDPEQTPRRGPRPHLIT
ncbi:HNH endonuclease signature motif containing protein [Pseudonocardia asaccharolytica]|uniref:HNH endonuclease signature motif containing protein n=1 Tax=Pseudonocardia asaccharolytica TaxID=54010 RepID=UPI001B7F7A75|nr:HNH endonuclease signature motif containing protein [Pseudonocardia asaccharolytica]